jgi:hypothetical protein
VDLPLRRRAYRHQTGKKPCGQEIFGYNRHIPSCKKFTLSFQSEKIKDILLTYDPKNLALVAGAKFNNLALAKLYSALFLKVKNILSFW